MHTSRTKDGLFVSQGQFMGKPLVAVDSDRGKSINEYFDKLRDAAQEHYSNIYALEAREKNNG
jgi:hypothetical protein